MQAQQGVVSLLVAQIFEEHMGCALENYDRTFAVHSHWFMGGADLRSEDDRALAHPFIDL